MSTYLGSTLISGVATETKYNANTLLDYKPSDHKLNSMEWLRSNTFSWQSGKVYKAAYNHLSADYSGGTSKTETIGSYTISFVEATDGHRITTDEKTVANIYNESGTAWFYVLDTTNQRFKLPRSTHGEIVKKYHNGTDWYRIWSDGWCEQGGAVDFSSYSGRTGPTITFLVPFIDTNYNIEAVAISPSSDGSVNVYATKSSATQCVIVKNWTSANYGGDWRACGYASKPTQNAQYKYLYFYVGEYSQSATEQTAGINAEMFNDKADVDAVWTPLTSTSAQKETIVGWGMPDYTSGVSKSANTSYTAESNGFIYGASNQQEPRITIDGTQMLFAVSRGDIYGGPAVSIFPIKKGSTWSCTIATTFFPAVGG